MRHMRASNDQLDYAIKFDEPLKPVRVLPPDPPMADPGVLSVYDVQAEMSRPVTPYEALVLMAMLDGYGTYEPSLSHDGRIITLHQTTLEELRDRKDAFVAQIAKTEKEGERLRAEAAAEAERREILARTITFD
jgi:hypothetical protein